MKLSDFYKKVVTMNELETGGWGPNYYGVMSKIIQDNNYKVVAEVGIGYGTHTKQVLRSTNVERMYLIDPMCFYPNDQFAEDIMNKESIIPDNHFNEMVDLISNELSPWKNKWIWFRKPSLSITSLEIPDDTLDCIFVDGDHSYEAVLHDLRFWWKKVKKGGQMLGDDYWMDGVARAVHEFADENNLPVQFYVKQGKDYKIFYFKK
jgi:hypothetical protein